MRIGQLAKATDTAIETIRFYEREGLLLASTRTSGNFRVYGPQHTQRLAFIRYCRGLDMSLDEVRVLLHLRDGGKQECGDVNRLLDAHIAQVAQRIRDLQALEQQLKDLRSLCRQPTAVENCSILQEIGHGGKERTAPIRRSPPRTRAAAPE